MTNFPRIDDALLIRASIRDACIIAIDEIASMNGDELAFVIISHCANADAYPMRDALTIAMRILDLYPDTWAWMVKDIEIMTLDYMYDILDFSDYLDQKFIALARRIARDAIVEYFEGLS